MKSRESEMESIVSQQLSMFAVKPTANFRKQDIGQLMIDVLELSCPPKELMRGNDG